MAVFSAFAGARRYGTSLLSRVRGTEVRRLVAREDSGRGLVRRTLSRGLEEREQPQATGDEPERAGFGELCPPAHPCWRIVACV